MTRTKLPVPARASHRRATARLGRQPSSGGMERRDASGQPDRRKRAHQRLRRAHQLQVHACRRGAALRAHGAALSGVPERRRAHDERRERAMHGARVRGGGPAVQVRDPETDGNQEEPHDGGSVLGMPGLSGPREPGMRTEPAANSRTRRRRSARAVVNGRAPRPGVSDQKGSVRTFRPPSPGRLTAQTPRCGRSAGPWPPPR